MNKLEKTLQNIKVFINNEKLIKKGAKVLVAISGGPDSVFLAYALHTLNYSIGLVHINYQLRGDTSDFEEKLVLKYAETWGVPVYYRRMDSSQKEHKPSQSSQVIYRNFRYDFFSEIISKHGYEKCATAHHRGDQAESILMSLTKGNHPAIIQSIPQHREPFIRPLLNISKQDILDCLTEAGLTFSHDISNDGNDYLRNQFRNQVIPLLQEINPSIESQLVGKHTWYQTQTSFIKSVLDQQIDKYLKETASVKRLYFSPFIEQFGRAFLPILCTWALERWGLYGNDLWESIKLIHSDSGRFILTPKGKISKGRDMLVLEEEVIFMETQHVPQFSTSHTVQMGHQQISFIITQDEKPDFSLPNTLWFDYEQLLFPILLRRWQHGDRMIPLGMKQQKKLSDIFIDQKYDAAQKNRTIIFESQGQIIALHPFRVSDQVKLSPQTKKILKVVIED